MGNKNLAQNNNLLLKIEQSDSNHKFENEISESLKSIADFLSMIEKSGNKNLLEKFEVKYLKLEKNIIDSLLIDNEITQKEFYDIKSEISNFNNIEINKTIISPSFGDNFSAFISNKIDYLDRLEKNTYFTVLSPVIKTIKKYFSKFKKMFSSLDSFIKGVSNLKPEESKFLIEYINKRGNEAKVQLRKGLLEEFKDKENKEAIVEKLINEIFEKIRNGDLGDIYLIIDKYKKENSVKINSKFVVESSLIVHESNLQIEMINANIKGDKLKIEKIKHEIIRNEKRRIINSKLKEPEIETICNKLEKGEKFPDIIKEISNENDELKIAIQKHEKKYKDYYKKEKEIQKGEKSSNKYSEKKEVKDYEIDYNTNTLTIIGENINKKIVLSKNDRQLIDKNPEITEQIIAFHDVLDEVGLLKLWPIKEDVCVSITNKFGTGFNIKEGFLNENETKIFLNSILKSCSKLEIPMVFDIENFKKEFKNRNGVQFSGDKKRDFFHEETKIEKIFIEKFFPRGSAVGFKNEKFEKAL